MDMLNYCNLGYCAYPYPDPAPAFQPMMWDQPQGYEVGPSMNDPFVLYLSNIPNNLSREQFQNALAELWGITSDLDYDALHVPMDFSRESGKGYAFVRFITRFGAEAFRQRVNSWGGPHWGHFSGGGKKARTQKVLWVSDATTQEIDTFERGVPQDDSFDDVWRPYFGPNVVRAPDHELKKIRKAANFEWKQRGETQQRRR
jgi:hypothetical protein